MAKQNNSFYKQHAYLALVAIAAILAIVLMVKVSGPVSYLGSSEKEGIRVVEPQPAPSNNEEQANLGGGAISTGAQQSPCDSLRAGEGGKYFSICADSGFDSVCFNKYSGEFQGCTSSSNNMCTEKNANKDSNVLCSV